MSGAMAGHYSCPCCDTGAVWYDSLADAVQQRTNSESAAPYWLIAYLILLPLLYIAAGLWVAESAPPAAGPPPNLTRALPPGFGELLWPRIKSCSCRRLFAVGWVEILAQAATNFLKLDADNDTWTSESCVLATAQTLGHAPRGSNPRTIHHAAPPALDPSTIHHKAPTLDHAPRDSTFDHAPRG